MAKVQQKSEGFRPVTITLESLEEVKMMLAEMGASKSAANKEYLSMFEAPHPDPDLFISIYDQLAEIVERHNPSD